MPGNSFGAAAACPIVLVAAVPRSQKAFYPNRLGAQQWIRRMNYFPAFFDLTAQRVLIVGGGEVALRKLALLIRSGAKVTVVAPEVLPELSRQAAAGTLTV